MKVLDGVMYNCHVSKYANYCQLYSGTAGERKNPLSLAETQMAQR